MSEPATDPRAAFEAAQRAVEEQIRATFGIPAPQMGSMRDAVWKTDKDTGQEHLVFLNRPLCPPTRLVREWWPGYTSRGRCHVCEAIERQLADTEDDGPKIEEEQ